MGLLQLFKADSLQVTDVTSVVAIQLVLRLVTRHNHLGRVDNHDVIAGIDVRCINGLVLATQSASTFGCHVAQGLAFGINDEPFALDLSRFGADGSVIHGRISAGR